MSTIKLSQHVNNKRYNALFCAIVLVLVFIYLLIQPIIMSIEQVAGAYESKAAAYFVSFVIMLLCALTPLPAELIALANTIMYSPLEAFIVTWLSAVLSAHVGYEFGRLSWFDPCDHHSSKICRWLKAYGYKALIAMRLIPVVPFFALNICAGIFKLDRAKYLIITSLTIVPAVAALTFFSHLFLKL